MVKTINQAPMDWAKKAKNTIACFIFDEVHSQDQSWFEMIAGAFKESFLEDESAFFLLYLKLPDVLTAAKAFDRKGYVPLTPVICHHEASGSCMVWMIFSANDNHCKPKLPEIISQEKNPLKKILSKLDPKGEILIAEPDSRAVQTCEDLEMDCTIFEP